MTTINQPAGDEMSESTLELAAEFGVHYSDDNSFEFDADALVRFVDVLRAEFAREQQAALAAAPPPRSAATVSDEREAFEAAIDDARTVFKDSHRDARDAIEYVLSSMQARAASTQATVTLTHKQRSAIKYAILAIKSVPGWAGYQVDELQGLLATAEQSASPQDVATVAATNEQALLAAAAWANSDTPISEALAYRDGFKAGGAFPRASDAALSKARSELHAIAKTYDDGELRTRTLEAYEATFDAAASLPAADDRPNPNDIQGWSVTVNVNACDILTIGHNSLIGIDNIEDLAPVVRTCAAHLLSFVGAGADHVGNSVALAADAKRGTGAQILFERQLTCEAITGAMAFGYMDKNPPPSDDEWLMPFWRIGRREAELEAAAAAAAAAAAVGNSAAQGNCVPPLSPARISELWDSMPGGGDRFMKEWGYQQFAQVVEREVRDSILTVPLPHASDASTVRTENFGLSAMQLSALRDAGLKPEEIAGEPDVQQERVRELLHWFARFIHGSANGRWAVSHAFELAYYIASNGVNRTIDMQASLQAAYMEGVNITENDRGILERIGAVQPRASAER
ncbi:hypothetical protein HDG34_005827 [Paraburkholderia sp. HC6.4b]|uniref:hypothetical protein n=1 Tax=unclassified Paraburkholderia TaxID=2615204 RepID=UPI00160DA7A5|nr:MULTISPECIES: hypothetical protein [unclassified Paraburkholderia]MBB5411861.1 hypothetical protein [Paraburkholderia sp. HC6.4b]MBB5450173.1 hypothetical protein [Paraburkholderia sp. Kb1A]